MNHPQVETKYGFSCDEGVLKMCEAVWESGIAETACSCQGEGETTGYLQIVSKNNVQLSKLSLRLYEMLPPEGGWSLSLTYVPPKAAERAEKCLAQLSLHFMNSFLDRIEKAVVTAADYMWKCHCGWKAPEDYFGNTPMAGAPGCPECGCYVSFPWQKAVYGKSDYCELEVRKRKAFIAEQVAPYIDTLRYNKVACYVLAKIQKQFNLDKPQAELVLREYQEMRPWLSR